MTEVHPDDIKYSKNLYEELKEANVARCCVSCGGATSRMGTGMNAELDYENALILSIFGGYSMFCDPQDDTGFIPGWTVVLCHDCAHEACDRLPWLEKIIEPPRSHAHTQEYKDENPDHYGWDYDMANGTFYPKLAAQLFPEAICTNCGHSEQDHEHKTHTSSWKCDVKGCKDKLKECWVGGDNRD